MKKGFLVLESGECFEGQWLGGKPSAGEVVFNTSHSGFEEIATDPSYFNQIMVMTSVQQGNYGVDDEVWESENLWIKGFICLDMQNSSTNRSWLDRLIGFDIPVIEGLDTRNLVLTLREKGTMWGAMVCADSVEEAQLQSTQLIKKFKVGPTDWVNEVTTKKSLLLKGNIPNGPKVALLDYGSKKNIIRELIKRCSEVKIFPSRTSAEEIKAWGPQGIFLSNGPGDPALVEKAVDELKHLIGWKFIFGICMGHQILCQALGGKTYKLKFGHRGSNHPVKDKILGSIYMTSQNHGYAVDSNSLPKEVQHSHINLNDHTLSGIYSPELKCMSVQFHPESHPGPRDAEKLFDFFIKQLM